MAVRRTPAPHASKESWAIAGLEALSEGGVEAVAVEPIAKRLGVTKGSFYWHFESRTELLEAALDLWERRGTADVIARLETIAEPAQRLKELLRFASEAVKGAPSHTALSSAREPAVRRALHRVAAARLKFLTHCYEELDMPAALARRRAMLAYAAYLGMLQLGHDYPSALASAAERHAYIEHVIETLVPSPPRRSKSRSRS